MTRTRKLAASWDRMRNIPGLGRNLVTVAVLVALGIGSSAYILSNYSVSWPWQAREVVQMDFSKGPGLVADGGQEVRIAGVKVGTISAATAQTDGVRVTVDLDPGHPVYANAHADLKSKTPLNDPYISLEPGGSPAPELATDGSGVIPASQTTRLIQPFEVLNNLDTRTREALTSLVDEADVGLKDSPQQLPGSLHSVTDALNTLKPVADQLQTRRQTIQTLVTDLSEISTAAGRNDGRLAGLVASLQTTLSTLANRDDQLGDTLNQLPGLGDDLRHALGSVNTLTGQLDPTLDDLENASDALPPALSKLTDTLQDAGPVVDAARPVVAKARPVVGDLRPLVSDAHAALDDLKPTTGLLPNATAQVAPWLPNLQAFIFQTSSAFSLQDANGGYGRAQVFIDASNPAGGLQNEGKGTSPGPGDEARTKKTGGGN
ncbi:MlaD family protein [Actinomycetospora endophytica]|uniref:MlaD family protein n=1 Tax=Actinomycetospora endophytica TaxID=2291215 RepID=A0ABS8PAM7_9PSEU|nr:MlaD family protein [Actinomycetospora endophytica]MCD2194570.1 MlaD family protein [Actinomycetospora endophytica]